MKRSSNLNVLSDKTGKLYSLLLDVYNNFILKKLNSNYKHAGNTGLEYFYQQRYEIASNLKLLDRTELYTPRTPHFTLKDHKNDFSFKPTIDRFALPTLI